jgi:hypothetical protein
MNKLKYLVLVVVGLSLLSYVSYRKWVGEKIILGGYGVTGIKNDLSTNSNQFLPTVQAVKTYADGISIGAGNKLNAISVMDYGAVANVNTTAAKVLNDTAFARAARNAASTQMIVVPDGVFYKGISWVLNDYTKRFNIYQFGRIVATLGSDGVILEGVLHNYYAMGDIDGSNTGGVDSTSFSAYQGNGFNLRNAYNCDVVLRGVHYFRAGIRCGGQSSTIPKGSQYNTIHFMWIKDNYIQIFGTTDSTTDLTQAGDLGNWSTSNWFYGGQIGSPGNGLHGTFGVLYKKGSTSNQNGFNRFNFNHFVNIGIEGMYRAIHFEQSEWCYFGPGRWESPQITKKIYLREDNTSSLGCYNMDISDMLGISESFFEPGGRGNNTRFPKLLDAGFAVSGQEVWSNGRGGLIAVTGDEPTVRNSTLDMFAIGGFGGNKDAWKGIHIIRPDLSIDDWISLDGLQTTQTGTTYTIPATMSTVICNPSAAQTITLPAAASFPNKKINVVNIHATTTVSISGGSTASIAPGLAGIFISDGTNWIDINKSATGGGGTSQWTTNVSAIYYNTGNVGIGISSPTARLDILAPTTTSGTSSIKFHENGIAAAYESGALWPYGGNLYYDRPSGAREKVIFESNLALIPSYKKLSANSSTAITNTATSYLTMVNGSGSLTPITVPDGSTIKYKGFGYISTTSGTQTLSFSLTPGGGSGPTFAFSASIPGSLSVQPYMLEFEITPTGTGYNYEQTFTLINGGTPAITTANGSSTTGWTPGGSNINAKSAWSASGNTLYVYGGTWELFRLL